ncbi:MAG: 5-oxoprolinase subunit PxpA [Ignavibacteriales bacterium]|nr:5-oxoprolinase subunit PxpA [Ignavibacteriales bacterium]
MKRVIDINSDVGERPEALVCGIEEKLIGLISSTSIACGGHAGDAHSILEIMKLCKKYDVGIGAHPSYPDRLNFGRSELNLSAEEITQFVYYQIESFVRIADANGFEVNHIKPHGALYNVAAKDEKTAIAISNGISKISKKFILYGLANSIMIDVWRNEGFNVAAEAFADRRYEDDGSLRSRNFFDAVYSDPEEAAQQALLIAKEGKILSRSGLEIPIDADTICIHSDTENSLEMIKEIRNKFLESGIGISRI